MYCSACGTQIQPELNYCSRCGSAVSKDEAGMSVDNVWQAITYVGGFGLIAFVFLILVMVKSSVDATALVAISISYLATLFGVCFMLLRRVDSVKRRINPSASDGNAEFPQYLRPAATTQLGSRPADFGFEPSVTEHTTRDLDGLRVERK